MERISEVFGKIKEVYENVEGLDKLTGIELLTFDIATCIGLASDWLSSIGIL